MGKGGGKARGAGQRRARERYRSEKFWKEMQDAAGRFPPITDETDPEAFERRIRHDDTQVGLRQGIDLAIKVRNHYAFMARLEPSQQKAAEFVKKMQNWASLQFRLEQKLLTIVRNKRSATRRRRLF